MCSSDLKLPATILLRALGYTTEEILELFFDNDTFHVESEGFSYDLEADRLRGETAKFDIAVGKKVLVEEGTRITARHIRELKKTEAETLEVPVEFLLGRVLSRDHVDQETGEVVVPCTTVITEEVVEKLREIGVKDFECIYTNDLDAGAFIADTLMIDNTHNTLEALVEIYRMMRPGEPPTKEAAENLFNNLFFTPERYDLTDVGRMKLNRRLGRQIEEGDGVLSKEDIVDVMNRGLGPEQRSLIPRLKDILTYWLLEVID